MNDAVVHPPAEVVIGLDVGTTAVKVAAFGLGSPWRRTAIREYPLLQPAPGWQVQDPDTILAAVGSALAECVDSATGAQVVGVSVSSAMHGLIGLDAAMRPLTPVVTWADSRSREEARVLRTSGEGAKLHRITGAPVHPMTPLTKLLWFGRHEPGLFASTRWWVGLKDYVLWRLTGTLVTELSSASGTGMLEMATRTWSPEVVDLAGVSLDQLPPILPTTAALGLSSAMAARVGLPAGTPIIVGAADGPLSNLGVGAMHPGVVGLSLGTSGAVRMVVPEPMLDDDGRLFCYALTDSAWVVGGAVSNGGIVVRWAGQVFGSDLAAAGSGTVSDEKLMQLAASVPAGSDGLVMLPYLLPERAPLWDPDVQGAFLGLKHSHTRGHFVRAAMEGVSLQLSTIVEQLERLEPVTSVRATGGAFRAPLWRQMLSAVLTRPVHTVGDAEGSALGAAALALFALGRSEDLATAPALLAGPDASPAWLVADRELIARYEQLRTSIPELVDSLTAVAGLFRAPGTTRPY